MPFNRLKREEEKERKIDEAKKIFPHKRDRERERFKENDFINFVLLQLLSMNRYQVAVVVEKYQSMQAPHL